jgi:hypothetical protein
MRLSLSFKDWGVGNGYVGDRAMRLGRMKVEVEDRDFILLHAQSSSQTERLAALLVSILVRQKARNKH